MNSIPRLDQQIIYYTSQDEDGKATSMVEKYTMKDVIIEQECKMDNFLDPSQHFLCIQDVGVFLALSGKVLICQPDVFRRRADFRNATLTDSVLHHTILTFPNDPADPQNVTGLFQASKLTKDS